jgi:hypothetical protein
MPGWGRFNWWGYHGDDGNVFVGHRGDGDLCAATYETFEEGNIVGCGVNQKGNMYFTKNGKKLGKFFFET